MLLTIAAFTAFSPLGEAYSREDVDFDSVLEPALVALADGSVAFG